jgi:hypothetical protein
VQAVWSVVGDRDGLVLVAVGDYGQDRAEDLLTGDGLVVGRGQQGGPDVVAVLQPFGVPESSGQDLAALVDADLDVVLDAVVLVAV